MIDKPTIPDLLTDEQREQDYPLLRREIGRELGAPKVEVCHEPYKARNCEGCVNRYENAPYAGSLEVASERLLHTLNLGMQAGRLGRFALGDAADRYLRQVAMERGSAMVPLTSEWYAWTATPAERCAVCLEALRGREGEKS